MKKEVNIACCGETWYCIIGGLTPPFIGELHEGDNKTTRSKTIRGLRKNQKHRSPQNYTRVCAFCHYYNGFGNLVTNFALPFS